MVVTESEASPNDFLPMGTLCWTWAIAEYCIMSYSNVFIVKVSDDFFTSLLLITAHSRSCPNVVPQAGRFKAWV